MGRKYVIKPYKLFDNVDISTDQTSAAVNVLHLDRGSIEIKWASFSIDGEIKVQGRNQTDGTFIDLDFDDTLSVNVDNDTMRIELSSISFYELRIKYVSSSGTGNMDAYIIFQTEGA